ncbi:hypothetical protein BDQ12DRAFT_589088, partial [Crucibulum laeve]
SLLDRTWLQSSRVHLFRLVSLNQHNVDDFTSLVISSKSTIPPFVKQLELAPEHVDSRWLRRLIPFLEVLTSVTVLHISNVEWSCLYSSSRHNFLSTFSPTVTDLHICNMEFEQFTDVLDIICASPMLTSISLDTVVWHHSSFKFASATGKQLPPSVKHLRLRSCSIRNVVNWLLSHSSVPIVHHLDAGPLGETDTLLLGNYLIMLGSDLLSLKLEFENAGDSMHTCAGAMAIKSVPSSELVATRSNIAGRYGKRGSPYSDIVTCTNLTLLTGLRTIHIDHFI